MQDSRPAIRSTSSVSFSVIQDKRTLCQIHLSRLQPPKLPDPWERDCRNP
ncbi:predicted protein [Plenodomus lingam JN3]|uniref:Predicted protein n=1 Tax=Leptosphaeria maculans (strain JN3 / isolate v23.1.3 / race Av1-4-5-6-7-8) TaxID=985895 RepID=E5A3J4_LEPMJ|nr:predicted protein [Plenodomus lingam JN3]CBX98207.1 predicted protein [Plenodomus lingam JN3]